MKNFKLVAITLMLACSISSVAQTGKDSVLFRERTIDRPLTLHKNQVRVSGAYGLYPHARRYDEDGYSVKLRTEGQASMKHMASLELKYGLTEFIQFTIASGYISQTIRSQWRAVYPDEYNEIDINSISQYKGLLDMLADVSWRLPWTGRSLDVVLSAGIVVPLVDPTAQVPNYEYWSTGNLTTINRFSTYGVGKGVYQGRPGFAVKYRTSKFAGTFRGEYAHGLTEGVGTSWRSRVDGGRFEYQKESYRYAVPDVVDIYSEFEYQHSPIFDIILGASLHQEMNGWSDYGYGKIGDPNLYLVNVGLGYEIIVTPRLWLRQRLQIPVAGKSADAPLGIITSLTYNFFH